MKEESDKKWGINFQRQVLEVAVCCKGYRTLK